VDKNPLLAFSSPFVGEIYFPHLFPGSLQIIIKVLRQNKSKEKLLNNLPDIQMMP